MLMWWDIIKTTNSNSNKITAIFKKKEFEEFGLCFSDFRSLISNNVYTFMKVLLFSVNGVGESV